MSTPTRSVLGKGIAALITPTSAARPQYFLCPIERVKAAAVQPRSLFDDEALEELAASIAQSGILQPVLVRRDGGDYLIVAGERRWRAAKRAGLREIPVVVKEANDQEAFTLALVENLQRADLRPIEMAEACKRLIDDYGLTQEDVAERIGKSRSAVANLLRLLKLEPDAKEAIEAGVLSEGHARQLVGIAPEAQRELMSAVLDDGLSVRETEARAREIKAAQAAREAVVEATTALANEPMPGKRAPQRTQEPVLLEASRELSAQLSDHFGVAVNVIPGGRGGGRIELRFGSAAALEALVDSLLAAPRPR